MLHARDKREEPLLVGASYYAYFHWLGRGMRIVAAKNNLHLSRRRLTVFIPERSRVDGLSVESNFATSNPIRHINL